MCRGIPSIALGAWLALSGVIKVLDPYPMVGKTLDLGAGQLESFGGELVRAVRAFGVFEVACAIVVLFPVLLGAGELWLGVAVAGFVSWDVGRFLAGDNPDCGCMGMLIVFGAWWQVAVKHALLVSLVVLHWRHRSGADKGEPAVSKSQACR